MTLWPIALSATAGGIGLAAWGAFHPGAQLFGRTIRRAGRSSTLALTFDDGPNPKATPRLLNLLDQHRARATFFLIGKYVRAFPELAAEISARGHLIGNHTDTHPSLLWLSRRRVAAELTRCGESVEQATGKPPLWMRPPFGFRGPQLGAAVRQVGLKGVVMWSVTARDWDAQPARQTIERLLQVRGGDIVLLHDGDHRCVGAPRDHTIVALEFWLPRWRDAGLEFVTLEAISGRQ